jgi:hypothetical protein
MSGDQRLKMALQEGTCDNTPQAYLFYRQGLIHISEQRWIQREFFPLAQEPALFGHFEGVEPDLQQISRP